MHADTNTDQIEFHPFAPQHVPGALLLSQHLSWPHRQQDWEFVTRISQGWVATQPQDGAARVVATALATAYGPDCFALNLIIVDDALQGRGFGREITSRALAPALDHECRLVATREGLPLYQKLGFTATHDIVQHQGPVAAVAAPAGIEWLDAPAEALEALIALDAAAYGAPRAALMGELVADARIAVMRDGTTLTGFAARRDFGRGEVIGPVVATNAEQAQDLIAFCAADSAGDFLRIDLPATAGLSPWLERIGLAHSGGGTAMVRQAKPRSESPLQTFALVSQALG